MAVCRAGQCGNAVALGGVPSSDRRQCADWFCGRGVAIQAVQIGKEREMHRDNGFSQFLFCWDWFLGVANIQWVCHSMDD